MVYTAIYSKNLLTYVALFHNDLCFTANHCIIKPILGVSSMGLHPGWIPLPNITSQWSVLYGNPLKCKSNFRSLLHRISSRMEPDQCFMLTHCIDKKFILLKIKLFWAADMLFQFSPLKIFLGLRNKILSGEIFKKFEKIFSPLKV